MQHKLKVPAAAALVAVVCAGCGGGGGGGETSTAAGSESFDLSAATTQVAAAADLVPSYAVLGTSTVKVGDYPSAVAVNSKTNKIYVVNNQSNNVTVVDGKTNKTTTVPVGPQPQAVAVDEATDKIYVANLAGRDKHGGETTNEVGSVTVIDGKTNKTTEVKADLEPYAIAVNSKTNKIYVANQGGNSVTVIDGKTLKAKNVALRKDTDTLTQGVLSPQDVKIDETHDQIFVAGSQSNTVAVIDGKTDAFDVVLTEGDAGNGRQTGFTPTSIAVDGANQRIYTADFSSHDMTMVDVRTKKATGIVPEDVQEPYVIAMDQQTNKVYMGSPTSKSVTVLDAATQKPITIGDLPGKPTAVAVNPVTHKAYFALTVAYKGAQVGDDKQISGVILEVDGNNKTVTTIAGRSPWAVAVNPVTNTVYVVNRESGDLTVWHMQ